MNNERKLRITLIANATFSTLTGIIMLSANDWFSELIGVDIPNLFLILGIGLLVFALSLIHTATRQNLSLKMVNSIIIQDILWIIGSAIIIGLQPFGVTDLGYWVIAIVAIIVADFAFFQWKFVRNLKNENKAF